jgi:hypothetical protein
MPFLSEIEYWIKSTEWQIDITIEEKDAPKDWSYLKGDINSAPAYKSIPNSNGSTLTFAAVSPLMRIELSDRMFAKGYTAKTLHWIN